MGLKQLFSIGCIVAAGWANQAQAATITGALGSTGQGNMTYRIGLGMDWDSNWWQSSMGRLTGYWDLGLTQWQAGDRGSAQQSVSFAPVFVYEFGSGTVRPFIEAGIGVSAFTGTVVAGRDLGSSFNFEDRLGVGVRFAENQRLGVRLIHYSNADIKQPNSGVESYSLFYSVSF